MTSASQSDRDIEASVVATYLRRNKQLLATAWERAVVAENAQLAGLDRAALIDHLPEVLDGLAAWIEGERSDAERVFSALADGHALQRLGYGVALAALSTEYRLLRHVIMTHLLAMPSSPRLRQDLVRLDDGLDRAIAQAVHRYAEGRDTLRDRFIGVLGHDLRNPLASASFAVQRLAEPSSSGTERKAVETIGRAIDRMSRLVADVLDFARGHIGGGMPTELVAADMDELCRTAVEEVQSTHSNRSIVLRTSGSLIGTFDRDRVVQALVNLIGNAVQHGEDPILVTAAEADDRRAVITCVSNRGKTSPAEVLHKLFDPFTRGPSEHRTGLGLGLYIVAEIVRAHGGTCDVTSRDAETSFTIRWPRTPRSETPERP